MVELREKEKELLKHIFSHLKEKEKKIFEEKIEGPYKLTPISPRGTMCSEGCARWADWEIGFALAETRQTHFGSFCEIKVPCCNMHLSKGAMHGARVILSNIYPRP